MSKFILIGEMGEIGQAYTLEEAKRLIEEAEIQGFDVLNLIHIDDDGYVLDLDEITDTNKPDPDAPVEPGSFHFEDWEIPY